MNTIKKPELRRLNKSVTPQPATEELPQVDTVVNPEAITEQPPQEVESPAAVFLPSYSMVQQYPVLQSVGNTGWQVSEIWRDLRVDSFCD